MQVRSGFIQLAVALLLGASLNCSSPYSTAESRHVLAGTVDGLEGKPVTLVLNGESPLEVAEDGAFSFPTPLAEGRGYVVTVLKEPDGHVCSVEGGTGYIAASGAPPILVHCPSTDASLVDLSFSGGTISPAFDPVTFAYTTETQTSLLPPARTTATVIAKTKSRGARVTVGGLPVASGVPSAPIPIDVGIHPIDVTVTAADGKTRSHYAIVVGGSAQHDYIKASNTRSGSNFGWSVALSGDTLAVGVHGDDSNATLIDGDETNVQAEDSGAVFVYTRTAGTWTKQAYIKASNTRAGARFGRSVALSGDTLAVGSIGESSNAVLVDGDESNSEMPNAGAVYVYERTAGVWSKKAYIKASNTRAGAYFGRSVALTADTLAVGAYLESSNATLIDGDESNASTPEAGAVYVYRRSGTTWKKEAYIKASNTRANARFGVSVALTADTLAVGASWESSNATLIDGDESNASASGAGSVYVYRRSGTTWKKEAYVKASNTRSGAKFGESVALSGDTLVVGAPNERGGAQLVNGDESDKAVEAAGAAYVYTRSTATWSKQAYIKASNTRVNAHFGWSVALFGDTLAVGAWGESSHAMGVDGDESDASAPSAGAVYLYERRAGMWSKSSYVKASNTRANTFFGWSIALTGTLLAVGAYGESSSATMINGDESNTSANGAGAVFVFQ